jgi:hypothetical protein
VVECTALEMRHGGNSIGGSNPSLSATPPSVFKTFGTIANDVAGWASRGNTLKLTSGKV